MVSQETLEKALKEGILFQKEGEFIPNPGIVSLIWHPQLQRWGLAFGTNASDAGFVLLEDYGRLWKSR